MTQELAFAQLKIQLEILYEKREASNIANWVMEYVTGITRSDRLIKKDQKLSSEQKKLLSSKTSRLLNSEPIQYVLEEAWFANKKFHVNASVLIPRPETEELVEWVIKDYNEKPFKSLLDIGTGSGCIPITLKRIIPELDIMSIDISSEALTVAQNNALEQNIMIDLNQIDFLDESNWNSMPQFDCIISNPPYIKDEERINMSKHVVKFEPSIALFVSNDEPFIFYKKIAAFGKLNLKKTGSIYLEINQAYGKEVQQIFADEDYTVTLRKDLMGNNRMIKAVKKG